MTQKTEKHLLKLNSQSMTVKAAGLKSVIEMSEISNVPVRTLYDMFRYNRQQFNVLLAGCVQVRNNDFAVEIRNQAVNKLKEVIDILDEKRPAETGQDG